MKNATPFTNCPYCGSDEGYYQLHTISGSVQYNTDFDGTPGENSDMYDGTSLKGGRQAYCLGCNGRLFRIDVNNGIRVSQNMLNMARKKGYLRKEDTDNA